MSKVIIGYRVEPIYKSNRNKSIVGYDLKPVYRTNKINLFNSGIVRCKKCNFILCLPPYCQEVDLCPSCADSFREEVKNENY